MNSPIDTPPAAPQTSPYTIPNLLSGFRLVSVPVFVVLFVTGNENAAVGLFAVAAWTDFFDGYIARRTGTVTELGKILDPLADRLFILALTFALVARDALPWWLAALVIGRDVIVLALFPALERRGIERIPVSFVGKSATAALLFGLTLLALGETTFTWLQPDRWVGLGFTVAGAVLYWVATVMYGAEVRRRWRAQRRRKA